MYSDKCFWMISIFMYCGIYMVAYMSMKHVNAMVHFDKDTVRLTILAGKMLYLQLIWINHKLHMQVLEDFLHRCQLIEYNCRFDLNESLVIQWQFFSLCFRVFMEKDTAPNDSMRKWTVWIIVIDSQTVLDHWCIQNRMHPH